jgi:alkylation response protein AidB-like acyl-CoA dehydrogenase
VRFAFDQEQREFAAALREFLERECTPKDVRAVAEGEHGRAAERWRGLAEMGVVGLTAPVDQGGLGMDEVGLVLLMEQAGRAALPEPFLEVTGVGIPLIRDVGSSSMRAEWLPQIARGEAMVAIGLGDVKAVAHAESADLLLLERGGSLHGVPSGEVKLSPQPSVDPSRRLATVEWPNTKDSVLVAGKAAREAAEMAFDRGALAAAAQLLGLADRMIQMATAYAKERVQFGKPIGTYQAVKHQLATALVRLEFARPVVYRAAWSVANDEPDRPRDVSMGKAAASEAASTALRASLQVHGAIGYTEEHDLHLYLKRARALASAWGTASWHRDRVADAVLG